MHKFHKALAENLIAVCGSHNSNFSTLCYDSRSCQEGSIFVALRGGRDDGHRYIAAAVEAGAQLIVQEEALPSTTVSGVAYWQVRDARRALSSIAACFYDHPSQELKVIGVTGTDGKTSISTFIYFMLKKLGFRCGLISTACLDQGEGLIANPLHQTTPESNHIQELLRKSIDNGCTHMVVESSSHGLSAKTSRLADVRFSYAVFSNLSVEHQEFHHSMDNYAHDKANLFRQLQGTAVINADDAYAQTMVDASKGQKVLLYGSKEECQLFIGNKVNHSGGIEAPLRWRHSHWQGVLKSDIFAKFYLDNLALAVLSVHAITQEPWPRLITLAADLKPPPGRMQKIDETQPFFVLIDYAHSPAAFAKLLPELRQFTNKRLIVVFGSAGERDRQKRAQQGEIADRFADIIVLTNEDPRQESAASIIQEIATGVKKKSINEDLFIIEERDKAIRYACKIAQNGDILALLGKGHETTMAMQEGEVAWNEEQITKDALHDLGFRGKE